MISFFSQRIPETSDEYELLQTHHAGGHLDEHEHSSSVSSSQFEKTPARGASPCVPLNHAWRSSEVRPNGGGQPSYSPGLALRFVLKTIMIMNRAICHKVHMNLKMPGPRGLTMT